MKKLFALALAATMAAGMTTVAFAASDGVYVTGSTFYKLGSDNRAEEVDFSEDEFEGGDKLVIPVYAWEDTNNSGEFDSGDQTGLLTYTSDYNRKVVASANWRVGGGAEVTIDWVNYSKIDDGSDVADSNDNQIMSVIVTLPENETNKVEDLAGTIKVGRTSGSARNADESFKLDVSYFSDATLTNTPIFDGGDLGSKPGIVSFVQDAGEIDIDFGDIATYTVNVDGQGKLNLAWNTDFNKEFGAMYDYANLYFFNFEGEPVFNKTGTMMVYAEPDTFIYEVTADGAKAIDEAEYDEDYEAWIFETRALTSYVVSDVELTEKTVTDTEDDTTDDGSKPIPDTGR